MDDFDVGDFGEDTFTAIATSSGITSTPARKDRFGWDILLEFKNPSSNVFWDSYESYYSVNVQVKGFECDYETYSGRDIRLSNILHMINSNNPQFFAFVSVKDNLVYLVHLNNELISSGLKRIRKEQAKDENVKLNKKYLRVNPHQHDVMIVRYRELKDALIKIIGTSPSEYIKKKQNFVKNVGYESEKLSLKGKVNPKELLDVELGLKDSTTLNMVKIKDIRFGIPLELKQQPISVEVLSDKYVDDNFSINSHLKNGQGTPVDLEIRALGGEMPLALKATLRVSSLSKEYKKFVLETDFFKMIFEDESITVNLSLSSLWNREEEINNIIHSIKVADAMFSERGFEFTIDNNSLVYKRSVKFNDDSVISYSQYLSLAKNIKWLFDEVNINKKLKFVNYLSDVLGLTRTIDFIKPDHGHQNFIKISNLDGFRVATESVRLIMPISLIIEGKHYIFINSLKGELEYLADTSTEPECYIIRVSSQELIYKTKARGLKTKHEVESRLKNLSDAASNDLQTIVIESAYNPDLLFS